MGRVSRAEVFEPSEVAICHVFARGVRRCFFLVNDVGCRVLGIAGLDGWPFGR